MPPATRRKRFSTVLFLRILAVATITTATRIFTSNPLKRTECIVRGRRHLERAFPKTPKASGCDHRREVCRQCWEKWLQAQVESGPAGEIHCAQCRKTLSREDIKRLAAAETWERYLDSELKAALSADPDFRWCMMPGCSSGQILAEDHVFCCVSCGFNMCVRCNVPRHEKETCEAYQTRAMVTQVEEEQASWDVVDKIAKLCPGQRCGRRIEKTGGCDHIQCSMCRFEFCWICLADYSEIRNYGNHYHKPECLHHRHYRGPF